MGVKLSQEAERRGYGRQEAERAAHLLCTLLPAPNIFHQSECAREDRRRAVLILKVPRSEKPLSPGHSRLAGHTTPGAYGTASFLTIDSHSPKRISNEFEDPEKKAENCVATVIYSFNRTVSRAPRIGHFRNPEWSCSKELIEGIIQLEHKGTIGAGKASLGHHVRKKRLKWQTYGPCHHSESRLATFFI